jgi:hypothetical protein
MPSLLKVKLLHQRPCSNSHSCYSCSPNAELGVHNHHKYAQIQSMPPPSAHQHQELLLLLQKRKKCLLECAVSAAAR